MSDGLFSDVVGGDGANDPFSGAAYSSEAAGDTAPRRCQFPDCSNAIDWEGGPGRPPKYCETHRGKRAAAPRQNKPDAKVPSISNVGVGKKVENSINSIAGMTSMLLIARNPRSKDAQTLLIKTPPFSKAMGTWGAESPRVAKMVSGAASSFAAITVVFTLFDLVWDLLANHGLVPKLGPKINPVPDAPVMVDTERETA